MAQRRHHDGPRPGSRMCGVCCCVWRLCSSTACGVIVCLCIMLCQFRCIARLQACVVFADCCSVLPLATAAWRELGRSSRMCGVCGCVRRLCSSIACGVLCVYEFCCASIDVLHDSHACLAAAATGSAASGASALPGMG